MLRTRAIVLLVLALAALCGPATAYAAAPPSGPAVIAQRGFESGESTLSIAPIRYSGDPTTTAWWGITPGVPGVLGSNALWCARTTLTGTAAYTSGYVNYTRGEATLTVNALQEYYSSVLGFRYLYESRASVDANAFTVRWRSVTTGDTENGPDSYSIPLASAWTTRTRDMSQGEVVRLSRDASQISFGFFGRERAGTVPYKGPAIDNVIVSGYKYGPVRSLEASIGDDAVELDWLKPYRAVDETATEERAVTYRVWRRAQGVTSWDELTAARATSAGHLDTTVVPGRLYEYAVQAWDTGTGAGYGHLTTLTAGTPDVVAPTVTSNAVASYANTATISLSAADSGRGVASLSWRLDSAATQTVGSAGATVTTSALGAHTLRYLAVDHAGNTSTATVANFTVTDTAAPSVSATVSASYPNAALITIMAADSVSGSGVHSIEYRFDNGTTQTVNAASAVASSVNYGPRTLTYRARDNAGNWSATIAKPFTITDTAAPSISASVSASYPGTATIPITAVDSVGGSGARAIEYRFDNAATVTVSSPIGLTSYTTTVTTAASGLRSLSYRARDSVSNWSASVVHTFTVGDANPPSVSATVNASYANTATILVTATEPTDGSGVHSIEYRFDNGTTQTVAGSIATATTSAYGARTITYRARDNAGNWAVATSKGFSVTDSVAPSVFATVNASYADAATLTIGAADTGGGSGVHSIEYRLDGSVTQTVLSAAATVTTSSYGAHTITYRARDNAGNWSSATLKGFSVTDSVAPGVTSSASASYADTATVTFAATDAGSGVTSISWRTDGGATQTVAGAAATATVVGYGPHSVAYWALDVAGNRSASRLATFTVTDSIAPGVTATVAARYENAASIAISASDGSTGSGVHSIEYRFDDAATQTVGAATATATTTSFGARTLRYRARDAAGNWSAVITHGFTVDDSIAPAVSTDALPAYSGSAQISIRATDSASGVASISWRLDAGTTQTVASTLATVGTGVAGPHQLLYWATDNSGNVSQPALAEFGIADDADPRLELSAPSGDDTVTVAISATDTASLVRWIAYSVDGAAPTTISVSPAVESTRVALKVAANDEPSRTIDVWAVDGSGRVASASAEFRVDDTVAPAVATDAKASYSASATINLIATDTGSGVARIRYRFNTSTATTVTVEGSSASAVTTNTAATRLDYVAEDVRGNTRTGSVSFVIAPIRPPVATITRVAGADRYAVAVGIARAGWPSAGSVTDIIIANGEAGKEADPLAAAGLAGAYDAPVVLVQAARLPAATRSYLVQVASARKAAGKSLNVHIVGGTASVPDARWNEIRSIPGVSATKHRIAGADRYAVTVAIANEMIKRKGGAINGVLIVNAENPAAFFDALAASPAAFSHTMPMLGVKANAVPASVAGALKGPLAGKPCYVVSAPTYVSASVYTQVGARARLSGSTDRHTSATSIATGLISRFGATASSVGVSSALPDALTGGALLGKRGGVMVFTAPSSLPASTRTWLAARKTSVASVYVLGGTASVTDGVKNAIASALR